MSNQHGKNFNNFNCLHVHSTKSGLRRVQNSCMLYSVTVASLIVGHHLATKVFIGKLPATDGCR